MTDGIVWVLVLVYFFHPLDNKSQGMVMTRSISSESKIACVSGMPLIIDLERKNYKEGTLDDIQGKCVEMVRPQI